MNAPAHRRGFTLLEVLVALALFAVAAIVLASAYLNIIQSLEAVRHDRAFEQEVRWVRERILLEPDLKVVEQGGETRTLDYGGARWQVRVTPTRVADLFVVELHVEYGDDEKSRRERDETFTVLRPSWSDPLERDKLRAETKRLVEQSRRERGVAAGKRP